MGRRRRAPALPEVEVLDLAGDPVAEHRVRLGGPGGDVGADGSGAGAEAPSGRGAGGPRRRRDLAVLGAAAVVMAVVLAATSGSSGDDRSALGGSEQPDDGDRTTTSRRVTSTTRRAPRTTTTTVVEPTNPHGPILPHAVGVQLVVLSDRHAELVELDTGWRRPLPYRASIADPWSAWPVRGGIVVRSPSGSMRWIDLRDPDRDPVDLPPGDHAVPVPDGSGVWLVRHRWDAGERVEAVLASPSGRSDPIEVAGGWGAIATGEGLLTTLFDTAFVVSPSGERSLGPGVVVGGGQDHVVVGTCASPGGCGLDVVELSTGHRRRLPIVGEPQFGYVGPYGGAMAQVGPQGQVLLVGHHDPAGLSLVAYGADGSPLADVAGARGAYEAVPLPDWSGVLLTGGGSTVRYLPLDGSNRVEDLVGDYRGERVLIVPP